MSFNTSSPGRSLQTVSTDLQTAINTGAEYTSVLLVFAGFLALVAVFFRKI